MNIWKVSIDDFLVIGEEEEDALSNACEVVMDQARLSNVGACQLTDCTIVYNEEGVAVRAGEIRRRAAGGGA